MATMTRAADRFISEVSGCWPAEAYEATAKRGLSASDRADLEALCRESGEGYAEAESEVLAWVRGRAADQDGGLVCGCRVQHDRSGVGHCWVDRDADDLPADVRLEIEGEIVGGGKDSCEDYLASNGQHYRWS